MAGFSMRTRGLVWRYRTIIQAAFISLLSYFTALITTYVGEVKLSDKNIAVIILGGLIVVFLMTVIAILVDKIIQQHDKEDMREHNIHKSGYLTLNREISNYIRIVRAFNNVEKPEDRRIPIDLMNNAVSELYETLETEYGTAVSINDHIEFEVTFMTLSLTDGKITVAAWANRDGRAPKSLAKRETDPEIYSETETAKLYQDENRTVRIIASTATATYQELYPGQKKRIRSSIIYPVVDDLFSLVGTLVVHCDRDRFFENDNVKFWKELLEPYTKRLALARIAAEKVKEQHPRTVYF